MSSSSVSPMASKSSTSPFDELKWVIRIRRTLEEELEDESEIPVCIFSVPKILMMNDPESFTPQQVAIGPYHNWRPDIYEMERYKLGSAKRSQKQQRLKLHDLVEKLIKLEPKIRACYHKYLEFNGETLAWMMAIDASFLLEFLQIYAIKEGKLLIRVSSRMSHLVDHAGRKSAHNMILRDIVMLENQIPLFVLRKMLELLYTSLDVADEMLASMLMGLYKEVSPFKMMEDLPKIQVSDSAHLLDFVYDMIVSKADQIAEETAEADEIQETTKDGEKEASGNSSSVKKVVNLSLKVLSKVNKGPVRLLKKLILSKPIKVVLKLPWTIISNLPGISILKQPVEYLFFSGEKEDDKDENEASSSTINMNKPPLVEEITIPCITELVEAGVRFSPTTGSITTIDFDAKTFTLYLPIISLDVNTEVVLRNLVAYEVSNASGPLVFTRYTEFMNGIIDTEEDAKVLREKGILMNRLKSDKEVADMWNGMSKSVRLTKVPCLDKVIEDVNKYYNGRWKIKAQKFMKFYIFGSWQILVFLATVILLLLMTLQAFCSVYSCARIFYVTTAVAT